MKFLEFKRCGLDNRLYLMREGNYITLLVLYVNGIVIAGSHLESYQRNTHYTVCNERSGRTKIYLGVQIEVDGDLCKSKYIRLAMQDR